ncbi:MAG TPA: type 1 glutamine amidotransferase [Usitatibacter sp.]|nr:type 1 glutamine amidotransferase [Usitatibacter sp.]
MKPVAIFRYARTEGPGHFATFLAENGLQFRLIRLDEGEPVPESCEDFSGLGFMGGPMSANDEYPWTGRVLELMRCAVSEGVPVIGHCLGGQMLSRALGGVVGLNPVKEIGWVPVKIEESPLAARWFGEGSRGFTTFQWHQDTFSIPPGGERILTGQHCVNQAYVVDDRHLGMQCHVEVTAEMIDTWCTVGITDIDEAYGKSPAVQDALSIRSDIPKNLPALSTTASRLYTRWIENLRH